MANDDGMTTVAMGQYVTQTDIWTMCIRRYICSSFAA